MARSPARHELRASSSRPRRWPAAIALCLGAVARLTVITLLFSAAWSLVSPAHVVTLRNDRGRRLCDVSVTSSQETAAFGSIPQFARASRRVRIDVESEDLEVRFSSCGRTGDEERHVVDVYPYHGHATLLRIEDTVSHTGEHILTMDDLMVLWRVAGSTEE